MAERALLARRCGADRYSCYASRWGGTESVISAVCAGTDPGRIEDVRWRRRPDAVGFPAVVGRVDHLSTAVLYRSQAGGATAFLVLWFGLPLPSARPCPSTGALAAVTSGADARSLRRRFRRFKGSVTDAIRDGSIPVTVVPLLLWGAIAALDGRERYISLPAGTCVHLSPDGRPDGS